MKRWVARMATVSFFASVISVAFGDTSNVSGSFAITHSTGRIDALVTAPDGNKTLIQIKANGALRPGDAVFTGAKSRIEIVSPTGGIVRLGSEVAADLEGASALHISSGAALVCLEKEDTFSITSGKTAATYKGHGTFILQVTGNRGFKIIHLEGKGAYSTAAGGDLVLKGGQLCFVLGDPSEFGDVYDIDILLLARTSLLLNAFPELPPTIGRIGLSLYVQELKLTGKYDALIGDAPTDDRVQLWTLEEGKDKPNENPKRKPKKPGRFNGLIKRILGKGKP